MAQPNGQFTFKWKEPTSFAINQNDLRSTNTRAARRGILEVCERNSAGEAVDPGRVDEDTVYQWLTSDDGPAPPVGHTIYWNSTHSMTGNDPPTLSDDPVPRCNPWLLATSIEIVRDTKNKLLFHVNVMYGTPGGIDPTEYYTDGDLNQGMIPLPASVAGYPYIRRRIWGDLYKPVFERTRFSGGEQRERFRLPTGTLFSEPFLRRHPTTTYIQMQYEGVAFPSDIEQIIEARLFTINNTSFAGNTPSKGTPPDNNGQDGDIWVTPPRWMITNIEYELVQLPTSGGGGSVSFENAYLFVYTLEQSLADGGWFDRRALVDKHFLTEADDLSTKTANYDDGDLITLVDCLLNTDGTRRSDAEQSEAPLYKDYEVQPRASWSFMRDN